MIRDFDGGTVVDVEGEEIGTVERTYIDEAEVPRYIEVRMGSLFTKHRLIPADDVEPTDDGLRVPYTKELVEESPNARASGDTLEDVPLEEIQTYYARNGVLEEGDEVDGTASIPVSRPTSASTVETDETRTSSETSETTQAAAVETNTTANTEQASEPSDGINAGSIGEVRDLGDVIEIPIVEEVLVKQPVVREVLRVRKSEITSTTTIADLVRKEDVEIDSDGVEVRQP